MEEVPEKSEEVPEKSEQVPEKSEQVPEKSEQVVEKVKKRSKVIEAPLAEELPREAEEIKPKRMGRPAGAKDSKPRQKKEQLRSTPSVEVKEEASEPRELVRREPDPVHDYYESKRMAVERVYHAQAEHWQGLLSHLM